jgi:hypothetical protein
MMINARNAALAWKPARWKRCRYKRGVKALKISRRIAVKGPAARQRQKPVIPASAQHFTWAGLMGIFCEVSKNE